MTEDTIAKLDDPAAEWPPREALALEFARRLAVDHTSLDDAFFAELHSEFDDAEILELGMMAGQYIGFGRLLRALDLEPESCPI